MSKKKFLQYLITAGIGAGIAFLVFQTQGGFSADTAVLRYHILCDAFFVPAAVLLSVGLLVFVADEGTFDMINYGVMKALMYFRSKEKREAMPKTFYDYKVLKHGKAAKGYGFLIIVGAAFLLASLICLYLYERAG